MIMITLKDPKLERRQLLTRLRFNFHQMPLADQKRLARPARVVLLDKIHPKLGKLYSALRAGGSLGALTRVNPLRQEQRKG
jgi:hypothetical protein